MEKRQISVEEAKTIAEYLMNKDTLSIQELLDFTSVRFILVYNLIDKLIKKVEELEQAGGNQNVRSS